MAAPDLSGLIQSGYAILATSVSKVTKRITAQLGDVRGATDTDNADWMQHVGFASRPPKVASGKAAAWAVVVRGGDRDTCIASQDTRGLDLYGNLADGETCVYAAGADGLGQARALFKANGSIALYTTKGNAVGGTGMGVFVNPDGSVSITSHNGSAVTIGADGSVKAFNASGGIQVAADGTIKLGSTKKIAIAAPNVTVSATAQPLVTQAGMTAALTAIAQAMTAIGVGSAANGPAGAAIVSAAIAAVTTSPPNVTKSFQAG